jgi:hypothetical protein
MLDILLLLFLLWLAGMVLGGLGLGALHVIVVLERIVRGINARMKVQYPRP